MSRMTSGDTHRLVEEMKREEWRSPSARLIREENARLHYEAEDKAYREHEKRMRDEAAARERREQREAYYANHPEARARDNRIRLIVSAVITAALFLYMVFDGQKITFPDTPVILLVVFFSVLANA